jgi:hypothetical protein
MRLLHFTLVCLILNGVFIIGANAQTPFPGELPELPPDIIRGPVGPPYLPRIDTKDFGSGGIFVQPESWELKDRSWFFYPEYQPPPPIPDQSSFVLTDKASLVISVPMFGYGIQGDFGTKYAIDGNSIYLDGFTLQPCIYAVGAVYHEPRDYVPRSDYLEHISPLAPGEYTIHLRYFQAVDLNNPDFEAFKADPEEYAKYISERDLTNTSLSIWESTLTFSVVPEPSAALLFAMAAGILSLANFVKRRRSR